MNESQWAEQILQELASGASTDTQQQTRAIVNLLVQTDFSAESQIRHSLKNKLINSALAGRKVLFMNTLMPRRHILRLTIVSALILIFALFAAQPGISFAQSIVQTLQTWVLGESTTAVRVEGDFIAVPGENGETLIQPGPQTLPEPDLEALAEESEPPLEANLSIEEAQSQTDFQLLQPGYLPEGYVAQGLALVNAEKAQVDYLKSDELGLIGLTQTVAGGINGAEQVTFSSDIIPVEVEVRGSDGLWISATGDFGLLLWEADGVSYQLQLIGEHANLETALQIAESLQ